MKPMTFEEITDVISNKQVYWIEHLSDIKWKYDEEAETLKSPSRHFVESESGHGYVTLDLNACTFEVDNNFVTVHSPEGEYNFFIVQAIPIKLTYKEDFVTYRDRIINNAINSVESLRELVWLSSDVKDTAEFLVFKLKGNK